MLGLPYNFFKSITGIEMHNLSEIKSGQAATIIKIGDTSQKKRLLDIGFISGRGVTVLSNHAKQNLIVKIDSDTPVSIARELATDIFVSAKEKNSDIIKQGKNSFIRRLLRIH